MGKGSWIVRLALAMALTVISAGPSLAQQLISLIEYRDRVAAGIRQQQPDAKIVLLGQTGLRVTPPGDEPKEQSMEQSYALYRDDPGRLAELLNRISRSFIPTPISAQSLRVLIRTERSNPPAGATGPSDRGLVRPIAGGLVAIVAIDGPDSFEFIRASRLRARLGLDDAAIWARALANTKAVIPYTPRALTAGQPARLESGKGLSSSLLVDEAFWNSRVMTRQGPVVVALPQRDEIYLAPLSDTRTVQGLREALANVADDPNTLSSHLLVRRNGRWELLP
jgi:hypothetical protein